MLIIFDTAYSSFSELLSKNMGTKICREKSKVEEKEAERRSSEGQPGNKISSKLRQSFSKNSEKRNIERLNHYLLCEKIATLNELLPVCNIKYVLINFNII